MLAAPENERRRPFVGEVHANAFDEDFCVIADLQLIDLHCLLRDVSECDDRSAVQIASIERVERPFGFDGVELFVEIRCSESTWNTRISFDSKSFAPKTTRDADNSQK